MGNGQGGGAGGTSGNFWETAKKERELEGGMLGEPGGVGDRACLLEVE